MRKRRLLAEVARELKFDPSDVEQLILRSGIKSIELHVFLDDSHVPDREAWQKEIDRIGFAMVLDPAFDVRRDVGFVKATCDGYATGFYFALDPAANIISYYPHIAGRVGARGKCATFILSGELPEVYAVRSAAAALAKLADGIWFFLPRASYIMATRRSRIPVCRPTSYFLWASDSVCPSPGKPSS
jgi:hypothetical protein